MDDRRIDLDASIAGIEERWGDSIPGDLESTWYPPVAAWRIVAVAFAPIDPNRSVTTPAATERPVALSTLRCGGHDGCPIVARSAVLGLTAGALAEGCRGCLDSTPAAIGRCVGRRSRADRANRPPAEFAPLYRRYVGSVYRYCEVRWATQKDAEVATAQFFARELAGSPSFRDDRFRSWHSTIAHNVVADRYRVATAASA